MELLRWKTRIAVLWIIEAVGMSSYMFLSFMESGKIEGIMAGEIGGMQISEGVLFFFAIFWFIPWILAFLSLTLKDSANRWTNFVLGILWAIGLAYGLIESAIEGESAAILVGYFLGIVAAALIAWYAWKLPKQAA